MVLKEAHKLLGLDERQVAMSSFEDALELVNSKDRPEYAVTPTSREIIQAMLERGDKSVSCWVSNSSEHPDHYNFWVFINDYSEGLEFPYEDTEGEQWKFATPFDHTTFQPITELPE